MQFAAGVVGADFILTLHPTHPRCPVHTPPACPGRSASVVHPNVTLWLPYKVLTKGWPLHPLGYCNHSTPAMQAWSAHRSRSETLLIEAALHRGWPVARCAHQGCSRCVKTVQHKPAHCAEEHRCGSGARASEKPTQHASCCRLQLKGCKTWRRVCSGTSWDPDQLKTHQRQLPSVVCQPVAAWRLQEDHAESMAGACARQNRL